MSYCSESIQLSSKATSILSKGLTKGTRNLSSRNSESQKSKPMTSEETREANVQHYYFKIMSYVYQKHRDHLRSYDSATTQFTLDINLATGMNMQTIFEKHLDVAKTVLEKLRAACTEHNYSLATWLDSGSQLNPYIIRISATVAKTDTVPLVQ